MEESVHLVRELSEDNFELASQIARECSQDLPSAIWLYPKLEKRNKPGCPLEIMLKNMICNLLF
jgi:hypothetical protein